jgi:hypothetical protein
MALIYGRPPIARGGKGIQYVENNILYGMHIFDSSDIFVLFEDKVCDYLIVGGGGAGSLGNNGQAGGGAGGLILSSGNNITKGNYSIVIGAGGAGSASFSRNNGNNTTAFGLTAIGGGGGGWSGVPGADGGSGGGNTYYLNNPNSYGGLALQPGSNPGIGYGAPINRRQASMPRGGGAGGEQSGANYYDGLTVWGEIYGIGGFNGDCSTSPGPAGRPNSGDGGGGACGLLPVAIRIATNGGSGRVIVRYRVKD